MSESSKNFSVRLVRTPGTGSSWGFKLMGGIGCWSSDGEKVPLLIQSIVANSIAARNGLEPGDIIIAIDGSSSANVSLEQAKMMLIRAGNEVNLVIRRDLNNNMKKYTDLQNQQQQQQQSRTPITRNQTQTAPQGKKTISVSQAFPRRMAPSPPLPQLPQTSWTGDIPEEITPTDSSVISKVGIVPFERSPAFNRLASGKTMPPSHVQTSTTAASFSTMSKTPTFTGSMGEQANDMSYVGGTMQQNHSKEQTIPISISSEGQVSRSFRALETDLAHSLATGARPASIFDLKRQGAQQQ